MRRLLRLQKGLTLIESIIGMIVLGFALSILLSGVFSSAMSSHKATYQAQSATLGHAIMTDMLSRQFDENSDPNGGRYRCGENNAHHEFIRCSVALGRDGNETKALTFNDVDDFIGCWGEASLCRSSHLAVYPLTDLMDASSAESYKHFAVEINVSYDDVDARNTAVTGYKRIVMTLYGSDHARYTFTAYRGNY